MFVVLRIAFILALFNMLFLAAACEGGPPIVKSCRITDSEIFIRTEIATVTGWAFSEVLLVEVQENNELFEKAHHVKSPVDYYEEQGVSIRGRAIPISTESFAVFDFEIDVSELKLSPNRRYYLVYIVPFPDDSSEIKRVDITSRLRLAKCNVPWLFIAIPTCVLAITITLVVVRRYRR